MNVKSLPIVTVNTIYTGENTIKNVLRIDSAIIYALRHGYTSAKL